MGVRRGREDIGSDKRTSEDVIESRGETERERDQRSVRSIEALWPDGRGELPVKETYRLAIKRVQLTEHSINRARLDKCQEGKAARATGSIAHDGCGVNRAKAGEVGSELIYVCRTVSFEVGDARERRRRRRREEQQRGEARKKKGRRGQRGSEGKGVEG